MRLFRVLEMWCRKQAAAAILPILLAGWLTGQSSQALTTFGKSNTQPPKEAPTAPPARACARQGECAGIAGSSCVRTHYEPATRCLCGDNLPPVNGQCEAQTKALYHVCSNSDECNDGLVCGAPNITGTHSIPAHLRVLSPQDKICQCDVETGFKEHDHSCSGAYIAKISLFAFMIATMLRKSLA